MSEMNGYEVREVPGKGRAIFATRAFAQDAVIFEEEPFVSCQYSWNAVYGYLACDHCLRPLEATEANVRRLSDDPTIVLPFPEHCPTKQWQEQFTKCPKCNVRYCSEDCRILALQRYHRAGCLGAGRDDETHPLIKLNEIWKKMHYPPETGTIMLIVRILQAYSQSDNKEAFLATLQSFQSAAANVEQKIYHKMLGENFMDQMEKLYSAYCEAFAEDHYEIFRSPEAFRTLMALMATNSQGIATSALAEWVKKVTSHPLPDADKYNLEKYIDDLYIKVTEFAGQFLNNEGSGLYLVQSKINHSCAPNAISTFPYSNDIVVLKAVAPIAPGEEICISYLEDCQLERSRHSRQKVLKENYIFLCQCAKCQTQANDPEETSEEEDDDDEDDDLNDGDDEDMGIFDTDDISMED